VQPSANSPSRNAVLLGRALVLISGAIVLYCVYLVIAAIITSQSTGLLEVSSSDPQAGLTVSQANRQAIAIGTGKAKVRLKPGIYQVSASNNGYQTAVTVHLYEKRTTTSSLSLITTKLSSNSSSLFSQLPIIGAASLYKISVGRGAVSNGSSYIVVITAATPQARQYALQWIRTQGYDPSDYKITFVNAITTNSHPYAN
jgi:hypothetical protein